MNRYDSSVGLAAVSAPQTTSGSWYGNRIRVALLSGCAVIGLSSSALANVMDFNNLATDPAGIIDAGTTITQNGFTITATTPGLPPFDREFEGAASGWQSGRSIDNGTTTVGMFSPNSSTPITFTLTSQAGTPFNFVSIDLGALNANNTQFFNSNATKWLFTGALAGGGTVTQTISSNPHAISPFALDPGFTDLTSVVVTAELPVLGIVISNGAGITANFDNIVATPFGSGSTPVPEPATLAILASGLALLGVARRR